MYEHGTVDIDTTQDGLPDILVPHEYHAQDLMADVLPDYAAWNRRLFYYLSALAIVWFLIVPLIGWAALDEMRLEALEAQQQEQEERRGKTNKQQSPPQPAATPFQANNFDGARRPGSNNDVRRSDVLQLAVFAVLGFFWTSLAILVFVSPYHQLQARAVMEIPGFLSVDECRDLTRRVAAAAERNVASVRGSDPGDDPLGYLKYPQGFSKSSSYNSTAVVSELSFLTSNDKTNNGGGSDFTNDDMEWLIQTILQPRLAPTLERLWGVPNQKLQLQDLFVSRYQAGTKRTFRTIHEEPQELRNHYNIAFRISLTSDFTGGQTEFWNRFQDRYFAETLGGGGDDTLVGTLVTFSNRLDHQDVHVRDGTRDLLIGTVSIVPKSSTQLSSWFTTYLNFPWLTTRLERFIDEQHQQYHKVTRWSFLSRLLADLLDSAICDTLLPHQHLTLINKEEAEQFRQAFAGKNVQETSEAARNWLGDDEL